MFGGGGGIHFGAFGVTSVFQARYVRRMVPAMEPNPQVKAATAPTMNGARPVMMRRTEEGFSSKFMVASRRRERAISIPMIL